MSTDLVRSRDDRVIAGVCGGLARQFGVDPTLARVTVAVLTLFTGVGVPLYAIAWLLMPEVGESESLIQKFTKNVR